MPRWRKVFKGKLLTSSYKETRYRLVQSELFNTFKNVHLAARTRMHIHIQVPMATQRTLISSSHICQVAFLFMLLRVSVHVYVSSFTHVGGVPKEARRECHLLKLDGYCEPPEVGPKLQFS